MLTQHLPLTKNVPSDDHRFILYLKHVFVVLGIGSKELIFDTGSELTIITHEYLNGANRNVDCIKLRCGQPWDN